jgi:hypothetical protein
MIFLNIIPLIVELTFCAGPTAELLVVSIATKSGLHDESAVGEERVV